MLYYLGINLQKLVMSEFLKKKCSGNDGSVTRDEVEDSNAEEFRVLITKLNKRTKTTPKGKNKQAGRRLEHSQTFNSHDMDTRKTTDQHRTADTRRTI